MQSMRQLLTGLNEVYHSCELCEPLLLLFARAVVLIVRDAPIFSQRKFLLM